MSETTKPLPSPLPSHTFAGISLILSIIAFFVAMRDHDTAPITTTGLTIVDEKGRPRAIIAESVTGGISIRMFDRNAMPRMIFSVADTDTAKDTPEYPVAAFYDAKGSATFFAEETAQFPARVGLLVDGRYVSQWALNEKKEPFMSFTNAGAVKAWQGINAGIYSHQMIASGNPVTNFRMDERPAPTVITRPSADVNLERTKNALQIFNGVRDLFR